MQKIDKSINASCKSKFSHFEQSEKSHKVYQKGFFLRKKQKNQPNVMFHYVQHDKTTVSSQLGLLFFLLLTKRRIEKGKYNK